MSTDPCEKLRANVIYLAGLLQDILLNAARSQPGIIDSELINEVSLANCMNILKEMNGVEITKKFIQTTHKYWGHVLISDKNLTGDDLINLALDRIIKNFNRFSEMLSDDVSAQCRKMMDAGIVTKLIDGGLAMNMFSAVKSCIKFSLMYIYDNVTIVKARFTTLICYPGSFEVKEYLPSSCPDFDGLDPYYWKVVGGYNI